MDVYALVWKLYIKDYPFTSNILSQGYCLNLGLIKHANIPDFVFNKYNKFYF